MSRRAPLLDIAFAVMEGPRRPMDFALVLHFPEAPALATLEAGSARAVAAYPRSASRLEQLCWKDGGAPPAIDSHVAADGAEAAALVERLIARPLELSAGVMAQHLIVLPQGAQLVTRMHHAAGDLMSASLWLGLQLGAREPAAAPAAALSLRTHPAAQRKSRYAFRRPAESIRAVQHGAPSGRRRFHRVCFAAEPVAARLGRGAAFTYNDLLTAVALDTLGAWNRESGGGERIGVWLPVNIRAEPFAGFGNGSSRVRVYAREPAASLSQRAREVHQQRRWSNEHGEWHVPQLGAGMARLPAALLAPLLRAYFHRPGVDMATTLFSHAQRLTADGSTPFVGATAVDVITHVIAAHPLAMAAIGLGGDTHLTFTWDEALYAEADALAFAARFEATRRRAFAEVLGA